MKYAEFCALTAARLNAPPFLHPPAMVRSTSRATVLKLTAHPVIALNTHG